MADGFNVAAAAVFIDLQNWTTREGAAVNKMESWASIVAGSCGSFARKKMKGEGAEWFGSLRRTKARQKQ